MGDITGMEAGVRWGGNITRIEAGGKMGGGYNRVGAVSVGHSLWLICMCTNHY